MSHRVLRLLPVGGCEGLEIEVDKNLTWSNLRVFLRIFFDSKTGINIVMPDTIVVGEYVLDWLNTCPFDRIPVIHYREDPRCETGTQTETQKILHPPKRKENFPPNGVSRSKYLKIRSHFLNGS
jgi:hypothetical protein